MIYLSHKKKLKTDKYESYEEFKYSPVKKFGRFITKDTFLKVRILHQKVVRFNEIIDKDLSYYFSTYMCACTYGKIYIEIYRDFEEKYKQTQRKI